MLCRVRRRRPRGKLGEGLGRAGPGAGHSQQPKNGGSDRAEIVYLTFPGSGAGWPLSIDQLNQRAEALFAEWGGMEQLRSCFVDGSLSAAFRLSPASPPAAKALAKRARPQAAAASVSR